MAWAQLLNCIFCFIPSQVASLALEEFIQFKGWLDKLIEILFTYCCIIRLANFANRI